MATIIIPNGVRHTATKGFYSGEIAETGMLPQPVGMKRGRGRPRKDVGETGAAYDSTALGMALFGKVKVPTFKGASKVYSKMAK